MPPIVADIPLTNITRQTIGFIDHAGERAKKVTKMASVLAVGNIEYVIQTLATLSHAGMNSLAVSVQAAVDLDSEPIVSVSGLYTLANIRLVLGFERVHPLNEAKIITAGYAIPAPVNDIVSSSNPKRPVMVREVTFAAAATDEERLGALVDYLCDALIYEDATGAITVGGWTYVESRSGLATVGGVIDGDIRT